MADRVLAEPSVVAVRASGFDALVASEQKRIFLLCRRLLNDTDEADSITQDVFIKAWRATEDGIWIDEPPKWLTRVAVNMCIDRLRSRRWQFWKKRPAGDAEETILSLEVARGPGADIQIYATQIERRLSLAMDKLSDRQRAVFALKHYEEKTLDEIAGILKLDPGSVKSHLSRALAKLRQELRDLYFRS